MKKILLFAALMIGANNVSAQALSQGTILVDAYYGFPNLYKTILSSTYESLGDNYNVTGYGPVGVRGEYLMSEKVGVGIDFGMNSLGVSYDYTGSTMDTATQTYPTYSDEISTTKIGVMVTLNYHIVNTDKVDFYFVAGAGYKNRSWKYESTDPNYESTTVSGTLIPVAARIGIGTRFWFTDNIGANVDLGFGHSGLLNAGLSFKF